MTRVAAVVLVIVSIVVGAVSVAADGSDDQSAAGQPPWTRSVVCPVLYTHEVPSQAIFRRFLTGLVSAGYQPSSLATVDAAMSGTADVPRGCVVLTSHGFRLARGAGVDAALAAGRADAA